MGKIQGATLFISAGLLLSVALAGVPSSFAGESGKFRTKAMKSSLKRNREPASLEEAGRLVHARELLGAKVGKKLAGKAQTAAQLQRFVLEAVRNALPPKHKKDAPRIARAIIDESKKHRFDPIFTAAVIENESSFSPTVRGKFGEIGLMQLKPSTAQWVAQKYGIHWRGEQSLLDPVSNIRIGTAYLNHLRGQFNSDSRLYISAYNMGTRNIYRALAKQIKPKDYASRVMKRYVRLYRELNRTDKTRKFAKTDKIRYSVASVVR